jgi:predicted nucleic acid-binding protein
MPNSMPFTRTTASADTCVLSDFIAVERVGLLSQLFPDGIRVDANVILELQDEFGASVRDQVTRDGCELLLDRAYGPEDYTEMAEIKRTRPAMRHPDIATVVLARKWGGVCLSSDAAVRKTCRERGILISGQLGCLQVCVQRRFLTKGDADHLLLTFVRNGLYLPQTAVDEFLRGS